jgi:ribose transport system ATP-binding protein
MSDIILQFKNISKSFPGVNALSEVNFDLYRGEVHAIVGENGAGKSTLLNVLSGALQDYEGTILYEGRPIHIKNPLVAKKLGINMVHQELFLVPELTVGQNIFLGSEPVIANTGFLRWKEIYKHSDEILQHLESNFSSRDSIKHLSTAQMQIVEIAKALLHKSSILALDEPTSSLSSHEIQKLFEIIQKLKSSGTSIIYVSHRLEEIFDIADRITVLRDGKHIGTFQIAEIDKPTLIKLMIGRDLSEFTHHTHSYASDEKVLEVKSLESGNTFRDISFDLRKGEILGIAGLVGSGRTEVVKSIFGAHKLTSGEIYLHGKRVVIKTPTDALNHGLALIPEDRKLQGLIALLSNASNVCINSLNRLSKIGLISPRSIKKNAKHYMQELQVHPLNVDMPTRNMSGGNQQKIVLSKWLCSQAKIMIFDEPTRGIDVGAKAEIYRLMDNLVKDGFSIIMVSSELPEIIGMSDRILVMHEGRIQKELINKDLTEEKILHYAMGVN